MQSPNSQTGLTNPVEGGTERSPWLAMHLLRVLLGMVTAMAIVIKYYVPETFRKQRGKWIPPEQRGKIIPFQHGNRSLHDMKTLRLVPAVGSSTVAGNLPSSS